MPPHLTSADLWHVISTMPPHLTSADFWHVIPTMSPHLTSTDFWHVIPTMQRYPFWLFNNGCWVSISLQMTLNFPDVCLMANWPASKIDRISPGSSSISRMKAGIHLEQLVASCYRFSCYYRCCDIAINSVNPSFIWRLEFSKNG